MGKKSCRYLEGGLAFRYGTVAACGVVHHGRGTPVLLEYNGGRVPFEELIERRRSIGDGSHPSCSGCPYLAEREDREQPYPVTWLGITHFNYCNVYCSYCWLQTASYSPRNTGRRENPYRILPIIRQLIDEKLLAPDAVIDWGGGGEPTLMPDFDESFEILESYGTVQWLHTNGVRVPRRAARPGIEAKRVRVLCSLDAGTAATYEAIKAKNFHATVCENLATYAANGAYVAVKYVMIERNCAPAEIEACLRLMKAAGVTEFVTDIDYDRPHPNDAIVQGLAYAKLRCRELQIPFQLGSTGINSAREYIVQRRVENESYRLALEAIQV